MHRFRVLLAAWLLLTTWSFWISSQRTCAAGELKADRAGMECRWATGPINIDGESKDPDWKSAAVIDRFRVPGVNAAPQTATRARLLWDREFLYFFAELDDYDLFADVVEQDGRTWDNDVFELFLRPAADKPGYYEFQVNAAGTRLDMFLPQTGAGFEQCRHDGKFRWKTAVARRGTLNQRSDQDEGWSVEGRIPWTDLMRTGGRPAVGEVWRFAICRYDYTLNTPSPELSSCAALTEPNFHQLDEYASLTFRGPESNPRQPLAVREPVALTTSRVIGSPDPPHPYRAVRAFPSLKLNFPIAVDRIPGSDQLLLIAQATPSSSTTILRIKDYPEVSNYEKVLDLPGNGTAYGICFHPRFADNGYFYVGWNGSLNQEPKKSYATRFTMDRKIWAVDPASALHVISWESDGHNGADLEFGRDGMLYITSGDGTSDSDTNLRGQDLTKYTAKLLRIDVDHAEDGRPYRVPEDNPFVGQPGVVPETWALGFRNPWRIAVDPHQGHIWVGNNGQDLWEQIFFVRKGDNFGWSVYEGSHLFYANRKMATEPLSLPAAEHHHREARSLTGGVVYYGDKLPELRGAYLYGDYSTGKIWGIKHDGHRVVWHQLLADTTFSITGFGLDSHGELLIADHRGNDEGACYSLEPAPPTSVPSRFPRKLSDSGLFADVPQHRMAPGVIPYSVNSPLWSDGAIKERFLAVPQAAAANLHIDLSASRGWEFPDETVLVKSFALETTAGDPKSRRWIETRFLTKQAGEWVGYSYRWNDDFTDAELVDADGLDRTYEIQVPRSAEFPDGIRRQTWHYPSRSECMVCHSRAANFVLGLSTAQMNKEHDYGGGVMAHQFHTLEQYGFLKIDYRADAFKFLQEDLRADKLAEAEVQQRVAELQVRDGQRATVDSTLLAGSPDRYPRLVDPADESQPLEKRARSYLHANCSICHVEAGGGNSQMQLEYNSTAEKFNAINVPPLHHRFGIDDARIIAPGHPGRSVLLYRMSRRGEGSGQMPQVATNRVDHKAVKLLEEWIRSMDQRGK